MFLFLLPYSKRQSRLSMKNCTGERFSLLELEPLARTVERVFLSNSELSPLYRRFKSLFWENLEFWVLPPPVAKYVEEHSWVLSPVYGLLKPTACLPYMPVGWEELYEGERLKDFWKRHLRNLSEKLFKDKVLVPFVGKVELSLFDLKKAETIIRFEYYRKDQKVKNPSRYYAYTLRYMAERGISLQELERINFYDYRVEKVVQRGRTVKVVMRSEGRYEV